MTNLSRIGHFHFVALEFRVVGCLKGREACRQAGLLKTNAPFHIIIKVHQYSATLSRMTSKAIKIEGPSGKTTRSYHRVTKQVHIVIFRKDKFSGIRYSNWGEALIL